MNESLLLYVDHGDCLHIIDASDLPYYDDAPPPLLAIAIALANSGYEGVRIDEHRLANGQYLQALNVNVATPEGQALTVLEQLQTNGRKLPTEQSVLEAVRDEHERRAQHQRESTDD